MASDLLTANAKDTADWAPNFDEGVREPVVVCSRLPNLLMDGSGGSRWG